MKSTRSKFTRRPLSKEWCIAPSLYPHAGAPAPTQLENQRRRRSSSKLLTRELLFYFFLKRFMLIIVPCILWFDFGLWLGLSIACIGQRTSSGPHCSFPEAEPEFLPHIPAQLERSIGATSGINASYSLTGCSLMRAGAAFLPLEVFGSQTQFSLHPPSFFQPIESHPAIEQLHGGGS